MKQNIISSSMLLLLGASLLASCNSEGDKFDYDRAGLYVSGTESDPVVKFVVEDTPSNYLVTVQSTKKVDTDVSLTLAIDPSKVDEYNKENKTNFFAIPSDAVQLESSQVTISAGNAISSAASVKVLSTENFVEGRTYMIPVTVKSATGGLTNVIEGSRTIYLRISRVINFSAVDADYNASSTYFFDKPIPLTTFTYEMKLYPTGLAKKGPQRFCALEQLDETKAVLLRFNEANENNQLQCMTPAGTFMSTTEFNNGQWYMLSIVFDGSNVSLYVNGVLDNSTAGSLPGGSLDFQRFEMGMSWAGYRASQFFGHRFCEFRVWDRALSASEIQGGLCGVDAQSEGLKAYWKFNEGQGHLFKDATNNGFDMDWSLSQRSPGENNVYYPNPDAADYIHWVSDDINKCAQ